MPSLEIKRISCFFAAIIATRNGTDGSNFHVWNTIWFGLLRCLATGWLASLPMAAYQCSPNFALKVFQFLRYKACHIYCLRYSTRNGRRCTWNGSWSIVSDNDTCHFLTINPERELRTRVVRSIHIHGTHKFIFTIAVVWGSSSMRTKMGPNYANLFVGFVEK